MGTLMDLVAGDTREILLAVSVEDWAGFGDRERFPAHLPLGGGIDPTWLDLFAEAIRDSLSVEEPGSFLDARWEIDAAAFAGDRAVERVDPRWLDAVAALAARDVERVAGRWVDLLEEEYGELAPDEKPWIRQLADDIVAFARRSRGAPDVVFAWSI